MNLESVSLVGPCAYCGRFLGNVSWALKQVIAATGPEGAVLLCVSHALAPRDSPEYKAAVRKLAAAKAEQLRAAGVKVKPASDATAPKE